MSPFYRNVLTIHKYKFLHKGPYFTQMSIFTQTSPFYKSVLTFHELPNFYKCVLHKSRQFYQSRPFA